MFILSPFATATRTPVDTSDTITVTICTDCQPGDLLFFAGRDWLSRGIALKTCAWRQLLAGQWFSHVGVCCDYAPLARGADGLLTSGRQRTILVESTTLADRPCFIRGVRTIGVQAHLPAMRVKEYPGSVWRLRLRRPLTVWERQALTEFCLSTIGQPYNYRRAAELSLSLWAHIRDEEPLPDSWFCSDHAIEALKACNRVNQDHDPEDFSPGKLAHLVLHSGEAWPIRSGALWAGRSVRLK